MVSASARAEQAVEVLGQVRQGQPGGVVADAGADQLVHGDSRPVDGAGGSGAAVVARRRVTVCSPRSSISQVASCSGRHARAAQPGEELAEVVADLERRRAAASPRRCPAAGAGRRPGRGAACIGSFIRRAPWLAVSPRLGDVLVGGESPAADVIDRQRPAGDRGRRRGPVGQQRGQRIGLGLRVDPRLQVRARSRVAGRGWWRGCVRRAARPSARDRPPARPRRAARVWAASTIGSPSTGRRWIVTVSALTRTSTRAPARAARPSAARAGIE